MLLQTLQQYFGYTAFRGRQEEVIRHVLSGRDALVLMPTGGGKSICYQLPALLQEGVTLVISPLIALMKDQVDALRLNGIAAACLNSTQSAEAQQGVLLQLREGRLRLLYIAPERLQQDNQLQQLLRTVRVSLIAVDEAHCISHWGHDFRPEYLALGSFRQALPGTPVVALTATADQQTRQDIAERLALQEPGIFISSFNRPNIRYTVTDKREHFPALIRFLESRPGESGIIYCLSRQSTEKTAARLCALGYKAAAYHAGLEQADRELRQEQFLKDDIQIMAATIAFGMGIDKSNVRFVVHIDLPKNIEGYYQETGRAGRDGLPGEALLFYSYADVQKLQHFTLHEDSERQELMQKKLDQMAAYCRARICRRKYLLQYFDEDAPEQCGNCDVCTEQYALQDGTVIAQKALSAVARLQENYGLSYVTDFLRGSRSERIRETHRQLKTYGAGAAISREAWLSYLEDLVAMGYLNKTSGAYPILRLTEKSGPVLRGMEQVYFRVAEAESPAGKEDTGAQTREPYDKELFGLLRRLRKEIADSEKVPAFVVFSDATLTELATWLPVDMQDIAEISGFGAKKTEKYGAAFSNLIAEYCSERNIVSKMLLRPRQKGRR